MAQLCTDPSAPAPSASVVSPDALGGLHRSFCRQHRAERQEGEGGSPPHAQSPFIGEKSPSQKLPSRFPDVSLAGTRAHSPPAAGERGGASLWRLSPGAPALTWEGSPGRSPHLGPWRTLTFVASSGASPSEHLRQKPQDKAALALASQEISFRPRISLCWCSLLPFIFFEAFEFIS